MVSISFKSIQIALASIVLFLAGVILPAGSAQERPWVPADVQGSSSSGTSSGAFSKNTFDPADLEASWRKMPASFLHHEQATGLFPADTFQISRGRSFELAIRSSAIFEADTSTAESNEPGGTGAAAPQPPSSGHQGLVMRSVKRILQDQKELYLTPFKRSNLKWDALELGGTAALIAADRHIETHISHAHEMLYQNTSDVAIGGLGAALTGVWIWGLKGDHPHAKETGSLELETLVDTFLIYTPMQFLAARQRPDEGNGNGDFWKHHNINTSFPGGHAMFTFAMATVVSHEYSQWWVQALAYGAASIITVTRFSARDHWSSDMFIGSALGIGIGSHVFHAHCNPELSDSCKSHKRWIF